MEQTTLMSFTRQVWTQKREYESFIGSCTQVIECPSIRHRQLIYDDSAAPENMTKGGEGQDTHVMVTSSAPDNYLLDARATSFSTTISNPPQ